MQLRLSPPAWNHLTRTAMSIGGGRLLHGDLCVWNAQDRLHVKKKVLDDGKHISVAKAWRPCAELQQWNETDRTWGAACGDPMSVAVASTKLNRQ
eukprot:6489735-Amphidinium_carterae.2